MEEEEAGEQIRGGTAESPLPLAGKIAPSEGGTSNLAIEGVARHGWNCLMTW